MPGYSRMDIMRMSDEDLQRILREEGETLPGYMVSMVIDELRSRVEEKGKSEEELTEEETVEEVSEEESLSEYSDDNGEDEEYEDVIEEDLSEEEKCQRELLRLEEEKKERKKILIISSAAAGVMAIAVIGMIVWFYLNGQM